MQAGQSMRRAPGFRFIRNWRSQPRAGDLHFGGVRCEREVVRAGRTLEVGWALVDAHDQNLATFWATDFFLLPLLPE